MENNKLIRALQSDIVAKPHMDINDTFIYALKLLHSLTININESMHTILKNEVSITYVVISYIDNNYNSSRNVMHCIKTCYNCTQLNFIF